MDHSKLRCVLSLFFIGFFLSCSSSSKKSNTEILDQGLDGKQEAAQACFKSALAQGSVGSPVDSGEIELSVNVSPVGRVTHVSSIHSTMNSHYLENCVMEEVRRAKFPKDDGGRVRQLTRVYKFGTQATEVK